MCKEIPYDVSFVSPSNHSTNPSGIERQAEPDPCLARIDNSFLDKFKPAAADAATVNAANPDAEDESPVPVGKLFLVTTRAFKSIFAIFLILSKCLIALFPSLSSFRSSIIITSSLKLLLNSTVVVVKRLLKFMEILPFDGSLKTSFFLPQYLINAIFDGAIAVAFIILF